LKNHIWTQLSLGHITKQIYDKHKAIWWECVDDEEATMRDNVIQQQDIVHVDRNIKEVVGSSTKPLPFQFDLGFCII
jgi:hypothetical protein